MNNSPAHTKLVNAIMLAIGARPNVRVFQNNVGFARDPSSGQVVKFGTKGMADLLAIVGPYHLWIECKTGKGVQSEFQKRFMQTIHALAGPRHYVVARSVEDAVEAVEALT